MLRRFREGAAPGIVSLTSRALSRRPVRRRPSSIFPTRTSLMSGGVPPV